MLSCKCAPQHVPWQSEMTCPNPPDWEELFRELGYEASWIDACAACDRAQQTAGDARYDQDAEMET